MCGRAVLNADISQAVQELAIDRHPPTLPLRFNISPGYNGVDAPFIVRTAQDGKRELINARWWLIPASWNKPLKELPTSFNARAEGIATSPFFRDAFSKRRCLMPATGWYEFQGKAGKKRSFCFHLPDWKVLAFAGVYEDWISPEGEVVTSFAIVTSPPSPAAAKIHDRMPVVLRPEDYAKWLDPKNQDRAQLQSLLQPWAAEMEVYQTKGRGNDPRHDAADCLEIAEPELTLF